MLDRTPDDPRAIGDLRGVGDALVTASRAHIVVEETSLFPAARAALGADALIAIAREM